MAIPTVVSYAPESLGTTQVELKGQLDDTGGEACTLRGFKYSKVDPYNWQEIYDTGSYTIPHYFYKTITTEPSTEYVHRAYVINPSGEGNGSYIYFTTLSPDVTITVSSFSGVGSSTPPVVTITNPEIIIIVPSFGGVGSSTPPVITAEEVISVTIQPSALSGVGGVFPPELTAGTIEDITIQPPVLSYIVSVHPPDVAQVQNVTETVPLGRYAVSVFPVLITLGYGNFISVFMCSGVGKMSWPLIKTFSNVRLFMKFAFLKHLTIKEYRR